VEFVNCINGRIIRKHKNVPHRRFHKCDVNNNNTMKTEYGPAMMPDALHILLSDKMPVR
jgi:hypothetical protein